MVNFSHGPLPSRNRLLSALARLDKADALALVLAALCLPAAVFAILLAERSHEKQAGPAKALASFPAVDHADVHMARGSQVKGYHGIVGTDLLPAQSIIYTLRFAPDTILSSSSMRCSARDAKWAAGGLSP